MGDLAIEQLLQSDPVVLAAQIGLDGSTVLSYQPVEPDDSPGSTLQCFM